MARSIWKGVISFGLVSVPVAMYSATREHEVTFHQFEKGTSDRIRYQRINERTGDEVEYEDIVRGADVGGGDYVMLEPEELDEIAPGQSRSLEIHQFVDLGEVDPIYFQKTYYLGPGGDETTDGTTKAYVLLRDSLAEANRAAIGTLVMRGKEYLAAVRADGKLLVLETMFFADEVRDPQEVVDPMPGRVKARPQELRMAGQLIESMTAKWVPEDFRDSYTDRVKDLIEAKKDGDEVTAAEPPPDATEVTDLMEALRRSVEATRKQRSANSAGETGGARRAGARKAGAKKAATQKAGTEKAGTEKAGTEKAGTEKAGAKGKGAKEVGAKKAGAKKAGAKKAGAKKAGAKKAGAKKAGAKKAGAKKAGAKKAGTRRAGMRVTASSTAKKAA